MFRSWGRRRVYEEVPDDCRVFRGLRGAQTKISGTGKCGKPEQQQSIEVGDRPGHVLAIVKQACTWTTPIEMAGVKAKSYTAVISSDASGGKSTDRGYVIVTMENGDQAFVRINSGMSVMAKDGSPMSDEGHGLMRAGRGSSRD